MPIAHQRGGEAQGELALKRLFQAQKQNYEVNHEEQYDGNFQPQHHSRVLVVLQDLVEVIQRLELAVNGAVPVGQDRTVTVV